MEAQLEIIAGPDRGRTFTLQAGQTLAIGRGPASETRLADPFVSRQHCKLRFENGVALLTHLSSAGGTFVNGKQVTEQVLHTGDVIHIGDTQLRVALPASADEGTLYRPAPSAGPSSSPFAASAPTPAPPVPLPHTLAELPGCTLDRYQVVAVLRQGQSGTVFRARDTGTQQEVALRVLNPELAQSAEDAQRFMRGMKAAQTLRHPNVVAVYAVGKAGSFCWTAMELVEGESLAQIIQNIGIVGILDWRYGLRIAIHIARALEFASQQGVLHRNIKPSNILVRRSDGVAKLSDLMLVKALEGARADQITRQGELVGDLAYMAPERTSSNQADCRADIYGLGATVYALLTGQPPCQGKNHMETLQKIRNVAPASAKLVQLSVPDELDQVVLRMLAKKPEERFQTATELLAALQKIAKEQGLSV